MIDCHFHLDESTVSLPGLVKSMDDGGIEKTAVIAPMCPDIKSNRFVRLAGPVFRYMIGSPVSLLHKPALALYKSWVKTDGHVDAGGTLVKVLNQPDNDTVIKAVKKHPDRFLGWIFVNPASPTDPLKEMERCLKTKGMIGVKAHPYWHNYPVEELLPAARVCQDEKLPMLIHLGAGENGDYRLLPENFPNLKVIYAHAGLPYQREVCSYAAKKDNVWVDLSFSGYVGPAMAAWAVDTAGVDKCLFGTDGPYMHHEKDRFDYGFYVSQFQGLGLDPEGARQVGKENFSELVKSRLSES